MLASDEVSSIHLAQRLSLYRPLCGGNQEIFDWDRLGELLAFDQGCVINGALRLWIADHGAVRDQTLAIDLPLLGGQPHQQIASRGRDLPQLQVHSGSGAASEGAHVERSKLSVSHHHLNLLDGNAQFFGDSLGERRADILANFNFAGINRHDTVFADVQPGADFFWKLVTAMAAHARFLESFGIAQHAYHNQAGSKKLEKIAAVDFEMVGGWGG